MLHIQVTGWRPVVVHDHFLLHCFRALLLSDHLCQNTLRLKGSPTKIQNARPVISPFLLPRNKVREVRGGSGVRDNVANTILVLDNENMRTDKFEHFNLDHLDVQGCVLLPGLIS